MEAEDIAGFMRRQKNANFTPAPIGFQPVIHIVTKGAADRFVPNEALKQRFEITSAHPARNA
jgi:hypothetical protein